jgi:myo-inositol 2-dehydrogenase/D-chiro-inositol 1-dehydrogenase
MCDVRFGLVGYGQWGGHHAKAITSCGGATLAAIAARSAESRARAAEDHPQAAVFEDFRQVVESDDVDVVTVVVPNHMHYDVARAALLAGKHVLLEKPMALSVEHCDELASLANERGRVLALNHELRLSTLWGRVKRLIDEGRIGTPQYVLVELSRFPYRQGSEGWRYDINRVGDWILEEPIHFFDLARWYLTATGEPDTVYARANARRPDRQELKDNFSAIVGFPGGAYAVVSQTLAAFEHHVSAKVVGDEGAVWGWWSGPDARSEKPAFGLRYGAGDKVTEVTFDNVPGELAELNDQIAAMVRCVRGGQAMAADGVDGRWSVAMCLAAARSVESGEAVRIEAVEN